MVVPPCVYKLKIAGTKLYAAWYEKVKHMKLLVISDTHGNLDWMQLAVRQEDPDFLIHLGDYTADAEYLKKKYPKLPILSVRGNCDWDDFQTREEALASYGGVCILAVHGHRYGVKNSLLRLLFAAKERAVQIALFGHTHCSYCENKDGLWMMNPGACSGAYPTYGVIQIVDSAAVCSIHSFDEGEDAQ